MRAEALPTTGRPAIAPTLPSSASGEVIEYPHSRAGEDRGGGPARTGGIVRTTTAMAKWAARPFGLQRTA